MLIFDIPFCEIRFYFIRIFIDTPIYTNDIVYFPFSRARSRDFALEYGKRLFCIEHDEMAYRHETPRCSSFTGAHTNTNSPIACRQHTSGCAPTGSRVCVRNQHLRIRHGDLCTVHSMNLEAPSTESRRGFASRDPLRGKMTRMTEVESRCTRNAMIEKFPRE